MSDTDLQRSTKYDGDTGEQLYTDWSESLWYVEPVKLVMYQLRQIVIEFACFANNASGGIQYSLEPVSSRLGSASQKSVTIIHPMLQKHGPET